MHRQVIEQHHVTQRARRDLLDQHLIERPPQIPRQPHRLRRIDAAVMRFDQPRQDHPPLQRIDRRRDRRVIVGRIQKRPRRLVQLRVADRHHAREQESPSTRPHERIGDRPLGTIGRHQHHPPRQPQRIAAMPPDQPLRERVGEGAVRGDGVEVEARGHGSRDRRKAARILLQNSSPGGGGGPPQAVEG